jgi:superfamily I DNA/RNA helicase
MNWDIALDRLPEEESSYISALLRRGQKIDEDPKIKISTIHGAKGGEAENVVVYTDISRASDEARLSNTVEGFRISEDLHRLFYVAVTRTKENLYLITPEDAVRSYQI